LAVDVHYRADGRGGSEPFGGNADRIEGFVRLVRGRTTEWLQVATFAICPAGMPPSRAEFVEYVSRHGSAYERKFVGGVFDEVGLLARAGGASRGA